MHKHQQPRAFFFFNLTSSTLKATAGGRLPTVEELRGLGPTETLELVRVWFTQQGWLITTSGANLGKLAPLL